MQEPFRRRRWSVLWCIGVGITLLAIAGLVLPLRAAGPAYAMGLLVLGAMAIQRVRRRSAWRLLVARLGLAVLFTAAILLTFSPRPRLWQAVLAGVGGQLFLLGLPSVRPDLRQDRVLTPLAGHLLVLAGTMWLAVGRELLAVQPLMVQSAGFVLLFLDRLWRERHVAQDASLHTWAHIFLATTSALLLVAAIVFVLPGESEGLRLRVIAALRRLALLFGIAVLAGPPQLPAVMVPQPSGPVAVMLDGISLAALTNVLVVLSSLLAWWLRDPILVMLAVWLSLAALLEYWGAARLLRRRRWREPPPQSGMPPLTVVLAVRNEAQMLGLTLRENLDALPDAQFLLAVSVHSSDDTLATVRAVAGADAPRVQIFPAAGTSKAADLTAVWRLVKTDLALILDADETVDIETLGWGLARLDDPRVAVVQARRVPRAAHERMLGRFVAVERQYSTLVDHPLQAEVFRAAHFAGSACLVRRELPLRMKGWQSRTLTEDIDFTLRLYLDTDATIAYEPRMVVHESNPTSWASLVRQRKRWARGWAGVERRHIRSVLEQRHRLGARRTFGLGWQLFTAVSAPVAVLLPALLMLQWIGDASDVPRTLQWVLAAWILPSRLVAFVASHVLDPLSPRGSLFGAIEAALFAYIWLVVGWIIQLHALYQEWSAAPMTWTSTRQVRRSA